jgi:dTDP-4-amino-4,6-dideoxygalactose transaminase
MSKLAIYGGTSTRTKPFPPYRTFDENEERAVVETIREGIISDYIGAPGAYFMGGKRVRQLEEMWQAHTGAKHAIVMNSATSVIIAAMAAFGLGPGDEVIVTPYSHVISATAPLFYDAIPIFADSEPDCLCMSVDSIREKITDRTKAIIVVDLFGQSADMDEIMALARQHGLMVLSDSAHITKATYKNRMAGTLAHIGSYSFNGHKTIQCGEGGMAVTDDDDLAMRLRLVRNHAENCVAGYEIENIVNMVGFNFRMTELEAAVCIEQTKKIDRLVDARRMLCAHLDKRLKDVPGLTTPIVRDGCTHDYLLYPVLFDEAVVGISRNEFLRRLDAEGIKTRKVGEEHVPPVTGFVNPIHLQPVFTRRIFRPKGYPWDSPHYGHHVQYGMGTCPIVESMWKERLFTINAVYPPLTTTDMDDIADAIIKVAELSRNG